MRPAYYLKDNDAGVHGNDGESIVRQPISDLLFTALQSQIAGEPQGSGKHGTHPDAYQDHLLHARRRVGDEVRPLLMEVHCVFTALPSRALNNIAWHSPFIHAHRRRRKPRRARASASAAVRVRRLAHGHLGTRRRRSRGIEPATLRSAANPLHPPPSRFRSCA